MSLSTNYTGAFPSNRYVCFETTLSQTVAKVADETGYFFQKASLLKTALTHRSFFHETPSTPEHNERLEFMGDAILDTVIRKYLFSRFPYHSEGELSQLKDHLVDKEACFKYATKIQLEKYVQVGRNVSMDNEKIRKKVLADAFEALLGAIFLDGGYQPVEDFFLSRLERIGQAILDDPPQNWKQKLQNYLQQHYQSIPTYRLMETRGADHLKSFQVTVLFNKSAIGKGSGFSKKEAEQAAAKDALKNLEKGLYLPLPQNTTTTTVSDNVTHDSKPLPSSLSLSKRINPSLLVQTSQRLVPPAPVPRVDFSTLSDRTIEIFSRIYENDPCLTVHFLNETLRDRELIVLRKILESNTVLHQLYLRSISIGTVGIKALKNILLFNKRLIRLGITYNPSIRKPLLQMVYNVLKLNHNQTLFDLRLDEGYLSTRKPIALERYWRTQPFDLSSLHACLEDPEQEE